MLRVYPEDGITRAREAGDHDEVYQHPQIREVTSEIDHFVPQISTVEPVTAATGVAIRATVIGSRAMTAILLSLLAYVHKDDCYPDTTC